MRKSRWNSYPIEFSPLFELQSKRSLARLLGSSVAGLKRIAAHKNNYIKFNANPGTSSERPIQEPLPWLKCIHVRLLDLLRRIQPPDYLKSGVRGNSIVSNAEVHALNTRGFKFDIKKFYPNVTRAHIFDCFYNTFRMASDVADLLTDLCVVDGHLPTGSVMSADLAFYANLKMFEKLARIAEEEKLAMTLWVDDITVSGSGACRQICNRMTSVVESHGFRCHKKVYFNPSIPFEVTGVLIHNGQMQIPNRRHKKLQTRLQELDSAANDQEFEKIAQSALGIMECMDQIQKRFAVRKCTLRKEYIAAVERQYVESS